jgi:hypothetical protein
LRKKFECLGVANNGGRTISEISKSFLKSEHKGVHQQFDMLVAAVHVDEEVEANREKLESLPDKQQKRWLKLRLAEEFVLLGHRPGFIEKGLLVYVYQLLCSHTVAGDEEKLFAAAAKFLDEQFESSGKADICAFIKQS